MTTTRCPRCLRSLTTDGALCPACLASERAAAEHATEARTTQRDARGSRFTEQAPPSEAAG